MSIASQISRIAGNVSAALLKIASKGVTVPSGSNSDDLADLIDLIPVYDDVTVTPGLTKSGLSTYMNDGTSSDYDVSLTPKYSNQNGHVSAHTDEPGTTEYFKIKTASPSFTGGVLSGKGATAVGTNATISDSTNNSGVEIQTSGGATRGAVTYDSAAEGWISKASGDQAMAAGSAETWTGTKYYINGVSITAPESGTRTFAITLPNGTNDTITLTVTVDSDGNWSIE